MWEPGLAGTYGSTTPLTGWCSPAGLDRLGKGVEGRELILTWQFPVKSSLPQAAPPHSSLFLLPLGFLSLPPFSLSFS